MDLDNHPPRIPQRLHRTSRIATISLFCTLAMLLLRGGLPALVCATGGLAETVKQGRSGYALPVEDRGELFAARAMDVLHNYEGFARAAFAEYETRLNWRVGVTRLAAILREAAGK